MSTLNAAQRNALKTSDFALPKERAFPIHDLAHAKDALSRVAQSGTPDEQTKVTAAVHKRYPELAGHKPGAAMSPNESPGKKSRSGSYSKDFKAPNPSALGSG
jgi:hypothetical protein